MFMPYKSPSTEMESLVQPEEKFIWTATWHHKELCSSHDSFISVLLAITLPHESPMIVLILWQSSQGSYYRPHFADGLILEVMSD